MTSTYQMIKRWRRRYPEKRRMSNARYYAKHRPPTSRKKGHRRWTLAEVQRITARRRPPDPVLAKRLRRSVQSIQVKRSKLRRKN